MNQTVIAIDGPAASGKGTVSKAISEKLQFNYLDTGKLYRAIGAKYLEGFAPITAAQNINWVTPEGGGGPKYGNM